MDEIAETAFTGDEPRTVPLAPYAPYDGGISIQGHAKQLCVNKLGHTMVVPHEEGTRPVMFSDLFLSNRLKTISYCAVFWSFGMCVAFLGPTLLDLECRLSSVFSTMSWIFFSQSMFTLIGAACGGFIVQRFNNNKVLLVSSTMLSVTLALVPYCTALTRLSAVLAIMGFFMGTIDTVANISMIELYGRNVAPFLQALHFFYGLGAFISPMVAEPFLMNRDCSHTFFNPMDSMSETKEEILNVTKELEKEDMEASKNSMIEYAFWILALMQVPVVLILLLLVIRDSNGNAGKMPPENISKPYRETSEGIEMESSSKAGVDEGIADVTPKQIYLITGLTASILFLYDGLQAGYGGYVFSYAVKSIAGMSMNEAAYLNAWFWGTFAFGRLVSIGLATRLAPSFMLICNIVGCTFAMTLMLTFHHNHTVLYLGTAILGTFMSSVYPTAVSLAETHINVTSFIASILVAGAALGEMIVPVIIGHEFDAFGPISLLISGLIMTLASGVIYFVLCSVSQLIIRQSSEMGVIYRLKSLFLPSKQEVGEDSGLLKHHVKYYRRMKSDTSESEVQSPTASLPQMNGTGGHHLE